MSDAKPLKLTHMDENHGKCDQHVSMELFQLYHRLRRKIDYFLNKLKKNKKQNPI